MPIDITKPGHDKTKKLANIREKIETYRGELAWNMFDEGREISGAYGEPGPELRP